ncbi:MAG: hypothetical protein M9932_06425 [Xanthobacteraceae bacterium]|nr:hypothetical protein [Xanthobacteraceae bacterium]
MASRLDRLAELTRRGWTMRRAITTHIEGGPVREQTWRAVRREEGLAQ